MKRIFLYILLPIAVFSLLLSSCSDGIFNFSSETGNISFTFTIDSSGGDDLSRVVFNFSNSNDGSLIRRELSLNDNSTECYISRVNTGYWEVTTTVYLADNTVAFERYDSFSLDLGETVIAELSYWSDGASRTLDISWDTGSSTDILPMISLTQLDTMIVAFHTMGTDQADATEVTTLIGQGSGFDSFLNGMKLTFPDYTVFEYSGGWARAISDLDIETDPSFLAISAKNYSSRGTYSLTLTDLNDVDVTASDDCSFGFNPDTGFATITSFDGTLLNLPALFDQNESSLAATYLYYIVQKNDGTIVNDGTLAPIVYSTSTTVLEINVGVLPTAVDVYVVLATLDAALSQTEIDSAFAFGTTNLSPDNLPKWLFSQFGDRINFVGMSVGEYTFP